MAASLLRVDKWSVCSRLGFAKRSGSGVAIDRVSCRQGSSGATPTVVKSEYRPIEALRVELPVVAPAAGAPSIRELRWPSIGSANSCFLSQFAAPSPSALGPDRVSGPSAFVN